jgi:hypothetical protein
LRHRLGHGNGHGRGNTLIIHDNRAGPVLALPPVGRHKNKTMLSGVTIRADDITSRVLEVGIPPGASAEQMAVFEEMAKYAQTKGATLIWEVIP